MFGLFLLSAQPSLSGARSLEPCPRRTTGGGARSHQSAGPARPPAAFKYAGGWGEEPSWLPSQSPLPGARGAGPSRLSVQLPLRGGLREAGLRSCALWRSLSAAGGWDEPARGVALPPSLSPFFLPPSLLPPSFPR